VPLRRRVNAYQKGIARPRAAARVRAARTWVASSNAEMRGWKKKGNSQLVADHCASDHDGGKLKEVGEREHKGREQKSSVVA